MKSCPSREDGGTTATAASTCSLHGAVARAKPRSVVAGTCPHIPLLLASAWRQATSPTDLSVQAKVDDDNADNLTHGAPHRQRPPPFSHDGHLMDLERGGGVATATTGAAGCPLGVMDPAMPTAGATGLDLG
jgi:hypothetical protein